ncbi:MAG: tetratricopeptide repeat protein [Bacteroidales bacterium]|nr:tetratricopeptide repeat protein [Bacteroidales bacterium]
MSFLWGDSIYFFIFRKLKVLYIMSLKINRDTIIDFLFGTLSKERMSIIADAIISNANLKNIYKEVRKNIIAHYYVDNELLPHERIDFEYKLKKNEKLLKKVNLQKNINKSLENLNLEETLNEIYDEYSSQEKQDISATHTLNRKFKLWLVAASISVLLILGGGTTYLIQFRNVSVNRLYASYYTPIDYTDSYLLNTNSFNIAKQKYMDGEYMNALALLNGLPSSLNIEIERDFFIGLSLMELGKYDNAIEYFQQIISNKSAFEYTPQIRWYMGLCYLKTGSKEKAIDTFTTIVSTNEYNYKKAKRILKKLSI